MHKGFIRSAGAFVRDLLTGKTPEVSARWHVIRGLTKDPFDSYEEFDMIHQALDIAASMVFPACGLWEI